MNPIGWFMTATVLCVIGVYTALFTVTTHKGLRYWVCAGFLVGVFISLLFILIAALHPA